jgi:hypothetical protein
MSSRRAGNVQVARDVLAIRGLTTISPQDADDPPNDRIQPRAKRDGWNAWLDAVAFAVTAIALRNRP